MMKSTAIVLLLILCAGSVLSEESRPQGAAPEWFLQEIATLTAGSGRWIADNSEYQSEQEPYDAYGTEWTASFDGTTMSGRLFAIKDGRETGPFWEFRQYWHPGHEEAMLEQFGWGGTLGIGTMWSEGGKTKSDQTFYTIDGGISRSGHVSHFPGSDIHITKSFDIEGDEWISRRTYTWHRAPSIRQR
jgi:hypothetical protein